MHISSARDASATSPSKPLDAQEEREFLAAIYFALDGQWFLKVREATDDATARSLNERMCASLARIQLRTFRRLVGLEAIRDATDLGRFVVAIHDALYGDHRAAFDIARNDPDVFEIRYHTCKIWDMGRRAEGQADLLPGELPGCAGILAMASAWARAAGPFRLERNPALDGDAVACVYRFVRELEAEAETAG